MTGADEPSGASPGPSGASPGDASAYGQAWADVYDETHAFLDTDAAVDALAELANGGPVLEYGVGTGRLALPLAARGLAVHGVEASPAMLARLRAKPGGGRLPVTVGDCAQVRVDGSFSLVVVAASTLFNLLTADGQIACLRNAAAQLTPGGAVVVEAFVPDPARWASEAEGALVERHDAVEQRIERVFLHHGPHGARALPVAVRYAWPGEIDAMARLAGLRREARWADWSGRPFAADSLRHVSVYRLSAAGTSRA